MSFTAGEELGAEAAQTRKLFPALQIGNQLLVPLLRRPILAIRMLTPMFDAEEHLCELHLQCECREESNDRAEEEEERVS